MNKKELQNKLEKMNVRKDSYSLSGGLPNEAFCLDNNNDDWFVYYSEKGNKSSLKKFSDEKTACNFFYNWLISTLKNMDII